MRRMLVSILAVFAFALPAWAEKRIALVIGENAYANVQPLQKAVGDAKGYAAALREQGYVVKEGYDLGTLALFEKIADFVDAIQPGDTAVFVYSGHGWSDGSRNYIVGADAPKTTSLENLKKISIPIKNDVDGILDDMERKGASLKVAIVDACRDNPFAPPAAGKGLPFQKGLGAMGPPPPGAFVVFSAGFGQGALDRLSDADADPNGVFTRVFLPLLREGLTLQDAVKAAQAKVVSLSRDAGFEPQKPAYYDEVVGPACLWATCKSAAPARDDEAAARQAAFETAMSEGTAPSLDFFLAKYPTGAFSEIARRERDRVVRWSLAAVVPKPAALPTPVSPCGGVTTAALASRGVGVLKPDEVCALKPGDVFKECADCPAMVVVPNGSFTMGSLASEPGRDDEEGPRHNVTMARAFAAAKFDVTRDQFATFVGAANYDAGTGWSNPGFSQTGSDPVVNVSWNDAKAYVKWLSAKTGATYRLLSESEWEYSAGDSAVYYWGAPLRKNKANCLGCGSRWDGKGTSPSGSFAPNASGLYDMRGNVWQWVEDCYHDSYAGAPGDGSPVISGACGQRVLRGGSWDSYPSDLRTARRSGGDPSVRGPNVGFRVARTLLP